MAESPGFPVPIKLQAQHRPLFPLDRAITEDSGKQIAAWAAGGSKPRTESPPPQDAASESTAQSEPADRGSPAGDDGYITPDQCMDLEALCGESGVSVAKLCGVAKVDRLAQIRAEDYSRAINWLRKHREAA